MKLKNQLKRPQKDRLQLILGVKEKGLVKSGFVLKNDACCGGTSLRTRKGDQKKRQSLKKQLSLVLREFLMPKMADWLENYVSQMIRSARK